MPVVLHQEVEGLNVGDTYTGDDEAWLLAEGYASQAAYAGPGVSNTGPADTTVANNPLFDTDRGPHAIAGGTPEHATNDDLVLSDAGVPEFANDPADEPLDFQYLAPNSGVPAGGTVVTIKGWGFTGTVTSVTFGGTAGTAFSVVDDNTIQVTTPAKAAGAYDVVLVTAGDDVTVDDGFTYKA